MKLKRKLPQFDFHAPAFRAKTAEQNRTVERHPRGTVIARGIAHMACNQAWAGGTVDAFEAEVEAMLFIKGDTVRRKFNVLLLLFDEEGNVANDRIPKGGATGRLCRRYVFDATLSPSP